MINNLILLYKRIFNHIHNKKNIHSNNPNISFNGILSNVPYNKDDTVYCVIVNKPLELENIQLQRKIQLNELC